MFGIWCEVRGGVTGSRGVWMNANGTVQTFDTIEQAAEHAAKLEAETNGKLQRKATFRYIARRMGDD